MFPVVSCAMHLGRRRVADDARSSQTHGPMAYFVVMLSGGRFVVWRLSAMQSDEGERWRDAMPRTASKRQCNAVPPDVSE